MCFFVVFAILDNLRFLILWAFFEILFSVSPTYVGMFPIICRNLRTAVSQPYVCRDVSEHIRGFIDKIMSALRM